MEAGKENFGSLLREARERRRMSLTEVSRKTKVPQPSLELLESGRLEGLPPDVFVRGFIRSYAKSVGLSDIEALGLYQKAVDQKKRVELALIAQPKPPAETVAPAAGSEPLPDEGQAPRRGIGLAVFVIIVLLIATITWSLFLRQPPQSGEGLSLADPVEAVEGERYPASPLLLG